MRQNGTQRERCSELVILGYCITEGLRGFGKAFKAGDVTQHMKNGHLSKA